MKKMYALAAGIISLMFCACGGQKTANDNGSATAVTRFLMVVSAAAAVYATSRTVSLTSAEATLSSATTK